MSRNPIEENALTRFVLGLAVIFGMTIGGGALGGALSYLDLPYGDWIGVGIGALLVFVAFSVLYARYDAAHGE